MTRLHRDEARPAYRLTRGHDEAAGTGFHLRGEARPAASWRLESTGFCRPYLHSAGLRGAVGAVSCPIVPELAQVQVFPEPPALMLAR